jgi:hypothetical protein
LTAFRKGGKAVKHAKCLLLVLFSLSLFILLEANTSWAQERFSTFVGKVIGVRTKLWLDVESQTDKAIMNFRIGRKTVYTPHRYPNPGEMVKVEYQTQRGVPVAYSVTLVEGTKESSKEGSKERPKETSKETPKNTKEGAK